VYASVISTKQAKEKIKWPLIPTSSNITQSNLTHAGYEYLKMLTFLIMNFWNVTPCNLVDGCQRFREPATAILRVEEKAMMEIWYLIEGKEGSSSSTPFTI
jgi:hypothetical protein